MSYFGNAPPRDMLGVLFGMKTKRLFMHTAERMNHPWIGSSVDLSRVDFGSGKRTIHPGGRLDKKHNLVVADTNYG